MKAFCPTMDAMPNSLRSKPKVISLLCLIITISTSLLSGCAVASPAVTSTPLPSATRAAASDHPLAQEVVLPVPTPDRTQIVSPQLASADAFPTPAARPTPALPRLSEILKSPPEAVPLPPTGVVEGALGDTSGRMSDNTLVNAYTVRGEAGEWWEVDVTSGAFDTLLLIADESGAVRAFNDDYDSKTGGDSRLVWTVPADGTYRLLVTSYALAEGDYTLMLTRTSDHAQGQVLPANEVAQGWLGTHDPLTQDGVHADRWTFTLPEVPVVIFAESHHTDIRLAAYTANGDPVVKNGDWDRVASDFNARLALIPNETLPPGSVLTIEVAAQGAFADLGAYTLRVAPLPTTFPVDSTVTIRPVIVRGANGERGSQVTEAEFSRVLERTAEIWRQCGIEIVLDGGIQVAEVGGLEFTIHVEVPLQLRGLDWTPEENALMEHPSHAPLEDGIITVYAVRLIGQGSQRGFSYPSTRYPSGQSGMVLVADQELRTPASYATLAHEIGHVLGVNHPDLDDGDMGNDAADNLMFPGMLAEDEQTVLIYDSLTPLQCITARSAPHFVKTNVGTPAVPEAFMRTDRNLLLHLPVTGALTPRDAVSGEASGQYVDVYYFYGEEGQQVQLDLTSADFDPFLIVDRPDGSRIGLDDDSGDGWNARTVLTLPATGDYAIGVTSYLKSTGGYELLITSVSE